MSCLPALYQFGHSMVVLCLDSILIITFSSSCENEPFVCCRFFDALLAKETRRSQRYRLQLSSFEISKNEFLCPLCETISNTVLPLMPSLQTLNRDRLLLCLYASHCHLCQALSLMWLGASGGKGTCRCCTTTDPMVTLRSQEYRMVKQKPTTDEEL